MHVSVCEIELRLPENHSLKGKRQVIQSMIARLQNKFKVSVAEVDSQDLWQLATLGVACVSNHRRHADETLANVVKFVVYNYPDVELLNSKTESFP
ncbi:MAG: DUF503 domain-containing protein [Dehalococcoidia bacterium]